METKKKIFQESNNEVRLRLFSLLDFDSETYHMIWKHSSKEESISISISDLNRIETQTDEQEYIKSHLNSK